MRLGAFELGDPLGAGGMGHVHRARHLDRRVDVAIKLLPAAGPEARALLRAEIRAIASLDHPCIVPVYDQGEVPADAPFAPGSPWLAMELAPTTLAESPPTSWAGLRAVLKDALAALAHAHARGILHRDVKPSNLLRRATGGTLLADFGISGHRADQDDEQRVRGTLDFMAPEQLRGDRRAQGPWTDLYALGCTAWSLATGRAPFAHLPPKEREIAQLAASPPRFHPRFDLPDAFEGWVRALLEKEPVDRFQRAAHASWALDRGRVVAAAETRVEPLEPDDDATADRTADRTGLRAPTPSARPLGSTRVDPRLLPPVPDRWQQASRSTSRLRGVGLGVFRLRTPPLVARTSEQERLWSALRDADSGQPGVLCLHGPVGSGKSRILDWLGRRADEEGAAWVLRTRDERGLAGALARFLRVEGLTLSATGWEDEDVAHVCEPDALPGLAQALRPTDDERSAVQRVEGLLRALEVLGRSRPVVVLIDDAAGAPQALRDVLGLLSSGEARRLLVVCAARVEELAVAGEGSASWKELAAREDALEVAVTPLTEDANRQLLESLLGLVGPLADELAARAGGAPLFAVQMAGDWVDRGILVPTAEGFALQGPLPPLPASLTELWDAQLDRLLPDPAHRRSLAMAAVLGSEVQRADWDAAARRLDLPPPGPWITPLLDAGLLRRDPGGWTFRHNLLRDSLEQGADTRVDLHRAAAHCLPTTPEAAERRGRHLLEAGEPAAAVHPLLVGAEHRRTCFDYGGALQVLDLRAAAMEAAGLHRGCLEWVQGALLRGLCFRVQSRFEEVEPLAAACADAARALGRTDLLVEALDRQAGALMGTRDASASLALIEQALEQLDPEGDPAIYGRLLTRHAGFLRLAGRLAESESEARRAIDILPGGAGTPNGALARTFVATALRDQGRLEEAEALYTETLRGSEESGNRHGLADGLFGLGTIHMHTGQHDQARRELARALGVYRALGNRMDANAVRNSLAEVDRHLGRLEAAEEGYRAVLRDAEARGLFNVVPWLNLGLVLLARDDFAGARELLETLTHELEARGQQAWLAVVEALLLTATVDEPDAFAAHLARARALLERSGFVDKDLLWSLKVGIRRAEELGRDDAAAALRALAEVQEAGLRARPVT